MSSESNGQRVPPELNFTFPEMSDIGKDYFEWEENEIQAQIPTDILLITANNHEFHACYSQMENVRRSYHETVGMVDFGQFIGNQKVKVTLMRSTQGMAAALQAVKNAADILYPKVVLFVGICATMKPEKAKLGHVVISAKLASYEHKKIKEDGTNEYRGPIANVSKYMSKLILSAPHGWKPPLKDARSLKIEVHCDNTMLSGSDLVDNPEKLHELRNDFPNALALEMEGAGLYAADLGIEWAVVKAVSDYGDGSKSVTEAWQPFSSAMAASLVRNMFKEADVIKNWPHYTKNIDPRMAVDGGKRPRQEERPNKDEIDAKRPRQEEGRVCKKCRDTDEYQLPEDRNQWPINKIQEKVFKEICSELDLTDSNSDSLPSVLGCFTQKEVSTMTKKYESKGGLGLAKEALDRWGSASGKNNVGALKDIVDHKMGRNDIRCIIERWEKLPVCHVCGKKTDNN